MSGTGASTMQRTDLHTPVRNHYFYGKLLDVYHFELETSYLNAKRWLLNRLVSGFGVVCGLDVQRGPSATQIIVTPGVAIDKWGREIIVPEATPPITIPPDVIQKAIQAAGGDPNTAAYVQVLLCYHECESDPAPVLAGPCGCEERCAPGAIRERYKVLFVEGCARAIPTDCLIPGVIVGGKINYPDLARWITKNCPDLPDNPCIPLANIRVSGQPDECSSSQDDIDVTIRPIVYSNDLLFGLLLCMLAGSPNVHAKG